MTLGKSLEDYLETILVIQNQKGNVRSIDIANHMGFSKPSVTHATKELRKKEFLTMDSAGELHLTPKGKAIAEQVYEKHRFFTERLMEAGVDPSLAEHDACQIEHAISDESFFKLKESMKK